MLRPNKSLLFAMVCAMLTLGAGSAFAKDSGSVATMKEKTHIMSLTFSPIHLLMPVVEITGEFKAHDQWSLALIGGGGSVTVKDEALGDPSFTVWEVGGQFRYYVVGDFDHGMQLGGEILYVNVDSGDIETSSGRVTGTGSGVSIAPFVGYKIATKIGFTFDAQLGIALMGLGASAEAVDTGETAKAKDTRWGPLLNLNVGWSF